LKYLSFKSCFLFYFLLNLIILLSLLFLEIKNIKSQQSKEIIKQYSTKIENILLNIIDDIYQTVLNISNEILESKIPDEKVAEINSRKSNIFVDWLNYDKNENYKIEYNVILDKHCKEILVGKPWIKKDPNGLDQYMLPIGLYLKNKNHSGILMLHFTLNQFIELLRSTTGNNDNFSYCILNKDMNVIINSNLNKQISKNFLNKNKNFYINFDLINFELNVHYLKHLTVYPLVIYYLHKYKLNLKNNDIFKICIIIITYSIISMLFFLFLMLEISKIKNKDKNLYLKEFKSINEKFKNIYTVLEIERQELAYLKVENTSLQKLNKTYLFEKHKAVNMLEEIDSESNKRLIENLALKERIKYLESNINNS
jgi:hypothetical protein